MSERTLVLCPEQEIDGNTVKEFLECLAVLDAEDGPIEVRVCCQGGWTEGAMAIHDAIKYARNEITTVGMGIVASAAVLIWQAGHKRLIAPNATIFLHETAMGTDAPLSKLVNDVRECARIHQTYCKLIAERSGLEVKTLTDLCKAETYIPADVAMRLNMADGMVGRKPITPVRRRKK